MIFLNVREFVSNDCVHFLASEMAKQVVGKQNAAAGARLEPGFPGRGTGGRFGPEPAGVYERWTEFAAWTGSAPRI